MRERRNALYPIAVSPARAAECLDVHRKVIAEMIARGMPIYRHGNKRRVLVDDLVAAIRNTWKLEKSHA